MGGKSQYEIPAGLKQAQERFAEWRSSHLGRQPIPESLWALASELAGQQGVFRTAQILRLDYTKLKRYTQVVAPVECCGSPRLSPSTPGKASTAWRSHAGRNSRPIVAGGGS